jgi:hypothetical protein
MQLEQKICFHLKRTAHIRHLCRKTTVLSCLRCLINTGIEKMNVEIYISILTSRYLQVKGNFGIPTTVTIFSKLAIPLETFLFEGFGTGLLFVS